MTTHDNRKLFHFYYTTMLSLWMVLLEYTVVPENTYAELPEAPAMAEVIRHVLYEDGCERMYAVEVESVVFVAIEVIQRVFRSLGCLAFGDVAHGQIIGNFSAEMHKLLDASAIENLVKSDFAQGVLELPEDFDVQATVRSTMRLIDSVDMLLINSSIEFVRAEITSYQTIGIPSWNVEDVLSQFRKNVSKCVNAFSLLTLRSMDPDDEIAYASIGGRSLEE